MVRVRSILAKEDADTKKAGACSGFFVSIEKTI